ncbi:flagellar basal body protein [Jatrophihabitans telluris]|uniref:Flagellar basal body rod protein FlgB n=1 Tax=Jatrophihabitans telluris TaxID=2038343 RepID=A0ABY4QW86_9ACTN|nr:flagellar basal body protein [Jatrophihabitans telluris]UQX87948.1 flagellar basal body protein [Jatrophihabitans telluris]
MLDDIASVTLTTALSGLSARQRVSANNIANIETPNFRSSQVSFEDSLRSAVEAGNPASATLTETPLGGTVSANGNDVNLDTELVTDEKSQMQYSLLSGALTSKFGLLETVIKG